MLSQLELPKPYAKYKHGQLITAMDDAGPSDDDSTPNPLELPVWCAIDDKHPRTAKPPREQIGAVSKQLEQCEYKEHTVAELAAALSLGCTVLPAHCEGARKAANWKEQQLWFLDIDNDDAQAARGYFPLTELEAVRRCQIVNAPCIMTYESFNSAPSAPRFRLIFRKGDAPEVDKVAAQMYAGDLFAVLPEVDTSTFDLNRLFFGTDKEVNIWL